MLYSQDMNILLVSPWPYHDVLTQSYVLPYIPYLRTAIANASKGPVSISLLTWENSPCVSFSTHQYQHSPVVIPRSPARAVYSLSWFSQLLTLFRDTNFNYIHAWCSPGAIIGFLLSLVSRTPLVLDSFEPHADAMAECGIWRTMSLRYLITKAFEILSAHHASAYFPVTKHMYQFAAQHYYLSNLSPSAVKPSCVPDAYFSLSKKTIDSYLPSSDSKLTAIYIGKLGGLYLDTTFFSILKVAFDLWPTSFNCKILSCQDPHIIEQYALQASFDPSNLDIRCVPHDSVPQYLNKADFAILPLKPVPSRLCCTPIKTAEYLAYGLPILATKGISVDSELIQYHSIGSILSDLSPTAIRSSLLEIESIVTLGRKDPDFRKKIISIGFQERGFHRASHAYSSVYYRLIP